MMTTVRVLSAGIVVVAAIWLIGLATAAYVRPDRIKHFFDKFASSAFSHFLEMFLRLAVGAAFVVYAPQMKFSFVFTVFGWLLILTTAVLLFVPWKMHRRFAEKSLPMVTSHMMLFGLASFLGGIFILFSFASGGSAL
jgi:hypothetical protein